ncbi:hypothetical protein TVAG_370830 [Trichomonas vaginalis G3]|uniref:receptor protein-tyrosine kinase n=1 Tax=Trichomonas vaginalis (strain ATCC PRA-98 / G3) TaxID=412133 RepID=A2FHN5_TRIV3|nr:glycine-rich protein family [Trichomonas vaginalis G3]EAX95579.1 hypothetical protein TVAG_370830 [Trichomonas vaginalis G3]KAI5486921.1 glycine-rich protein family [Trichomonas vaginalis G3]|eukprot:XP_001308509.1 hypothetical protein [Trichomonas vaginalis G3]
MHLEPDNNACSNAKGRGAYVSGLIKINQGFDFYIYVGEKGKLNGTTFNGNSQQNEIAGGGATDIRLIKKVNWYDFDSLKSRIMVAAGAGSGERICGGDGGKLEGLSNELIQYFQLNRTTGGTQTSGGIYGCDLYHHKCASSGRFGIGGSGNTEADNGSSGGGGYYGGGGASMAGSASGGSSFISGYQGCNAISENSTENHIYHSGTPFHYSGKYFVDATMIDGQHEMPTTDLKSIEVGHEGNGYAIITCIVSNAICSCQINIYLMKYFLISNYFIILS